MTDQKQNCVWIGIGADISEGMDLCRTINKVNNSLVEKYEAKRDFTGSEYPHLNLYDLSVAKPNLKIISEKIKKIAENQKSFIVRVKEVDYFPFGLFFLGVGKSSELKNLHRKIVEEIVKLKGECIDEDYLAPHRKYNQRQKELLVEYGNPHVLDQFQPHITIGHVKNQEDKLSSIQKELNKTIKITEFRINNLHITVGDGKNYKTLGKFNLIPAVGL